MYTNFIIGCFLGYLVTVSHSQAPTTPAPTQSVHHVVSRFSNDHKLDNLTAAVNALHHQVLQIDKQFEAQLRFRDIGQLAKLLEEVKEARNQATQLLQLITLEIQSAPNQSFLNRILQESLLIETAKYSRALKLVGLEILGDLSDVSKFGNYYYSESVAVVRQLMLSRITEQLNSAYQVDVLLDQAYKKDPLHGRVDKATKLKIDQYLEEIVTSVKAIKKDVASEYYEESEKIRLDGRELSLLQQMEIETLIDLLNYEIAFVQKYEQLVNRIIVE